MLPPQSVSVSSSSFLPLSQCSTHTLFLQAPLSQSRSRLQPRPRSHVLSGAQGPPQSMAVSFWFCTLSSQLGSRHTLPAQNSEKQSSSTTQRAFSSQRSHSPPPQSSSVSPLLRMRSEQWVG